jgi:hypothetical protein
MSLLLRKLDSQMARISENGDWTLVSCAMQYSPFHLPNLKDNRLGRQARSAAPVTAPPLVT